MTQTEPIRILVVDDQVLFRGAIAALLAEQPDMVVVGEADNGLAGVEAAHALAPDLVLLDIEMPIMDGVAAAALIREHLPATKVLVLTVDGDDEHLTRALGLGVHGYLLKDLRPDQLFDMIRAVMRDEVPVSPALVGLLLARMRPATTSPAPAASLPGQDLSQRELEIMRLVADGLSNREIGRSLSITEGTVKNHVHNALHKLHMDNRIQAAAYIVRQGLGTTGSGSRANP